MATSFDHEPHFIALLNRILLRPGTFVDIGANVGQTLIKILKIDPERHYIGFEPQIECCNSISQFFLDNNLSNAVIVPVALSDRDGMLQLFSTGGTDVMASTVARQSTRTTWIPAMTGDVLLSELAPGAISAIKIDVEGAEPSVLRGLAATIQREKPPIIFELLPNFFGDQRSYISDADQIVNNDRAKRIMKILSDHGYSIYQINNRGDELQITSFELNDRDGYIGCDYVARRA